MWDFAVRKQWKSSCKNNTLWGKKGLHYQVYIYWFFYTYTLSSREISTAFRRNSRNYKKYEITISGIHLVNFTPFLVTSVCSAHHPPVKGVICPFTLPSAVLIPPPNKNGSTVVMQLTVFFLVLVYFWRLDIRLLSLIFITQ